MWLGYVIDFMIGFVVGGSAIYFWNNHQKEYAIAVIIVWLMYLIYQYFQYNEKVDKEIEKIKKIQTKVDVYCPDCGIVSGSSAPYKCFLCGSEKVVYPVENDCIEVVGRIWNFHKKNPSNIKVLDDAQLNRLNRLTFEKQGEGEYKNVFKFNIKTKTFWAFGKKLN